MGREHAYGVVVEWTGNTGTGTQTYTGYSRDHQVSTNGPREIAASSDPAFRGDAGRWNPEQLFLAAVSQCHMLWYLNLAGNHGVVVEEYIDRPSAVMTQDRVGGGGEFTRLVLRPEVTISAGDADVAARLHGEVGDFCFIARSVRVPIEHEAQLRVLPASVASTTEH